MMDGVDVDGASAWRERKMSRHFRIQFFCAKIHVLGANPGDVRLPRFDDVIAVKGIYVSMLSCFTVHEPIAEFRLLDILLYL
jgi:hypothetical protein